MTDKPSYPKFRRYAWNALFALLYPFLMTFSLLFTAILRILSGISSLIVRLASRGAKAKAQETEPPETARPYNPPIH